MKQILLRVTISSVTLLFALSFAISVFAMGNNWVGSRLRTDLAEIYNAKDYRVQIKAITLPTSGDTQYTFTTGWLAAWLDASDQGFSQVDLIGYRDGLRWFAYSTTGITCLQGSSWFDGLGCRGALNQWVALNQFQTMEIWRDDSQNLWIARVYDTAGVYHDVASFTSASPRIYRADIDFEEGYIEGIDPVVAGQYEFLHPEYNSATGWKTWKSSADLTTTHNYNFLNRSVNGTFVDANFCDNRYATAPNHAYSALPRINGDNWYWQAGNNGSKCAWLFPPVIIDNPPSAALTYTGGAWTHHVGNPRVYNNTLSFSNAYLDKVTLASPTISNSISRVYVMATNRAVYDLTINGSSMGTGFDLATGTRYQVVKTWYTNGTPTVELIEGGPGGYYTDLDAFVIDIPRMPVGIYDDRHYSFNYVGSWKNAYGITYASDLTESFSNTNEDAATFTFEGNKIKLYYSKATNRGIAAIVIDGTPRFNLDMWAASTQAQQVWTSTALGAGVHTLHISNTGTKNASSTNTYIIVDKVQVE